MDENNKNIQENEIPKGMKKCKTCGKPVAKNAKICPNCGAKQKGGIGKIIIIVITVLILLGLLSGGKKDQKKDDTAEPTASVSTESEETVTAETEDAEEEIEYKEYSMTQLMTDLENNAAAANDTYKGQYVILTGKLSNIDAQGKYISIVDPEDDFAIKNCQCFINGNEEISNVVKTLSKGDIISVKGKIKDVGEVMGYSLDIEEIITE